MTNMATRAANPTQGVSTCGIVAPFLIGPRSRGCSTARQGPAGRRWGEESQVLVELAPEAQDHLGLEQHEDHREQHRGQATQQQQGHSKGCLDCIHRLSLLRVAWMGSRRPRGARVAMFGRVVAGKQRHLCNSYYGPETIALQVPFWELHVTSLWTRYSYCDMLHSDAEAILTLGPFDMVVGVRKPQYLSFSSNSQKCESHACGAVCNMHIENC
jgi:hypothetical protein